MNLEEQIYLQNPQWLDLKYPKEEKNWIYRSYYKQVFSWLDKRPAIALTGLRRIGKSTILKQIKYHLEEHTDPRHIFYFSFEKSGVRFHPDILRDILNWYFQVFLKTGPARLEQKVYLFLDEIQYIPYWQDVVKTFYDQSPRIKFFLSGSSSLFIKKKALESLAGRLIEMIMPPLSFKEFLQIKNVPQERDLERFFLYQKDTVNAYFTDYLTFGQFPETVKDRYTRQETKVYLDSVEEKVIEQDLPKLTRIERIDLLRIIFNFAKKNTGNLVQYQNLTADLGMDIKTVRKYFDYLQKSYLVRFCNNKTKKPIKSARTAKKIYLTSTCFADSATPIGFLAENYVFNFFSKKPIWFWRVGNFEVDFVIENERKFLPVEVKYQDIITSRDFANTIKLAVKLKSKKAYLLTKNEKRSISDQGVTLTLLPLALLETSQPEIV